jgi:hypothetical protein
MPIVSAPHLKCLLHANLLHAKRRLSKPEYPVGCRSGQLADGITPGFAVF